uniref:Alpha-1,3-glucosyltransferase n=1 Tax=Caenorhabditis tropicalis TaxID=1561998 RepID=A0A1I7U4S4_9PELO
MGEIQWILSVGSILIAFKCLLIPSYTSTDFEVHRNWMAITWNRPIGEWYLEETSQWTLDYPPFFAYFELVLAHFAHGLGFDECLEISKEPKMSPRILIFQRFSVIFTDFFYIFVCALYSFHSPRIVDRIPRKLRKNGREACFVLLASLQALLICDSIHFQYNSMLTAIFLLSLYFIDAGRMLIAALTFSILLNFKHIYVYYALGYVFFYLLNYFQFSSPGDVLGNVPKAITLATALLLPFIFSLFPFFHTSGISGLQSIAHRLFPVSRGLTHAFWAPNFWALYNFTDLFLYRILSLLKIGKFEPPTYTSGLVQSESQDDRIVFYERNGETRNSYVVKWPQNNQERRKIERIEWNPTGQILAMQTASGKASQLEFWHLSNYEFTRKCFWKFSEPPRWKWNPSDTQSIDILLSDGQFFSCLISPISSFSDSIRQNVVVATDELRMYSLCRRVVPPPMADYSIQCLSDVVAFTTSERNVHVITADWKILSFPQDTDGYQFNSDRASIDESLHSEITDGIVCGFVYDPPTESFILWIVHHGRHVVSRVGENFETLFEGDSVGWIGVNPDNRHVEVATNDGRFVDLNTKEELFRVDSFDTIQVHFTQVNHAPFLLNAPISSYFLDKNVVI